MLAGLNWPFIVLKGHSGKTVTWSDSADSVPASGKPQRTLSLKQKKQKGVFLFAMNNSSICFLCFLWFLSSWLTLRLSYVIYTYVYTYICVCMCVRSRVHAHECLQVLVSHRGPHRMPKKFKLRMPIFWVFSRVKGTIWYLRINAIGSFETSGTI